MSRTTLLSLLIGVALFALTSCDDDPVSGGQLTKLSFASESITVAEGQTYQLEVLQEPKELKVDFVYSNDNPEIATVNAMGLVRAIHEGTTKITVHGGGMQASVLVTVEKAKINTEQELPMLAFNPKYDMARNLIDEEVLQYEHALGRVVRNICYTEGLYYLGFVNKDLPTIPGVIYGIQSAKEYYILAYSKETVEQCDRTKEMFHKLGFVPFTEEKEVAGDGAEKIVLNSHKEDDPDVTVFMYNEVNEDLGTKMYIQINQKRYPEFKTQHPVVETAKDFPTLDFFKGADNDALQAFEDKLGFRKFNGEQSSDDNRSYDTTPEQIAKTNLQWVFYIRKSSSQGDLQYINCQVFAIPNELEIRSEAVKNWLAANGFNKFPHHLPPKSAAKQGRIPQKIIHTVGPLQRNISLPVLSAQRIAVILAEANCPLLINRNKMMNPAITAGALPHLIQPGAGMFKPPPNMCALQPVFQQREIPILKPAQIQFAGLCAMNQLGGDTREFLRLLGFGFGQVF